MRNYMMFFWGTAAMSVEPFTFFDYRTYCSRSRDDIIAKALEYVAFVIQVQGDPTFHIDHWENAAHETIPGPERWYLEMNKANLWALFSTSGSIFGGGTADQMYHSTTFPLVHVSESPRKTWSHNH